MKSKLILCLILVVNAVLLWPELSISRVSLNDDVLHKTIIQGMAQAENPLDFWTPEIANGMPITRLYQPLSHLLVVGIHSATFKQVDLIACFLWVRYLALVLLPLQFYLFARAIGLKEAAAIGAAAVCWIVSGDSFGLDLGSYVWRGHGLFPQLIATHFLLLTLGLGLNALTCRGFGGPLPGGIPVAGTLLALTGWSNLLYGYIAAVTLILMACMVRSRRVVWILIIGGAGILPRVIPYLNDSRYFPTSSPWNAGREFMYDSHGAIVVLKNLVTGQIFDAGRPAILTLLVLAGLFVCYRRGFPFPCLMASGAFLLWLALYFGRPFWGSTLYLIGITHGMHLHRFIGVVQIFGVILAGITLEEIWKAEQLSFIRVLIIGFCLIIPFQERTDYLSDNARMGQENLQAYEAQRGDLENVFKIAKENGGRVYAGMPAQWGKDLKIGHTPLYAFFPVHRIPSVGYLYLGFFQGNDEMYHFDELKPNDYQEFNVRTVIAPTGMQMPAFLKLHATFGNLAVYDAPGLGYLSIDQTGTAVYHITWHPKWTVLVDGKPVQTTPSPQGFIQFRAYPWQKVTLKY